MNRSPDDIFAAQFWAWPDPALKRDAQGRVLFVNAAFLQLFGGTVDAWRGQMIQGWNTPQPGPVPARFEIRTPATDEYPEQIYDWLEFCGRDGSAFALARNVTAFVTVNQPPPAAVHQPVDSASGHEVTQDVQTASSPSAEPKREPVVLDPSAFAAEAAMSHVAEAPVVAAAPAQTAAQTAPEPDIAVAPPIEVAPHAQPAPVQEASSEPERDFERRALPIENDEAVLGNNWRDAVIAKATGVEDEDYEAASFVESGEEANTPNVDAIRILLAEDNAINALLTRTLLEADGHTVETVEDGVLAVEAMKTQSYDMIFMDMRMPNMDGLEATRKIRALSNVPNELPIVALTANAFDDDRNACFDSGMNDFMTKPVSAEELSEMVTRWTGEEAKRMAS